jgi:sulfate permease, SulP family
VKWSSWRSLFRIDRGQRLRAAHAFLPIFVFFKVLQSLSLIPNRQAIPKECLAGLVVALGIIPEAIAFSIVAGVDPQVGLFGSICILIVVALLGGRPAMVSACTAGVALLMGGLM